MDSIKELGKSDSENVLPLEDSKEPLTPNYWGYTPSQRVTAYHEGYRWTGLTVVYGYEKNGRCMLALRYPDGEVCGFPIGAVTVGLFHSPIRISKVKAITVFVK